MTILLKPLFRGRKQLSQLIANLKGGLPDSMKEVAAHLHSNVMESFEREQDPWGKSWQALSPATLEKRIRRTKKGRALLRAKRRGSSAGRAVALAGTLASAKMLQVTGTLRRGYVQSSKARTAEVRITGPARPYGRAHQLGLPDNRFPHSARGVRAPVPARPTLPIRRVGGRLRVDAPAVLAAELRAIVRRGLLRGVR